MATFHFMAAGVLAAVSLPRPVPLGIQEISLTSCPVVVPSAKYFAAVVPVPRREACPLSFPWGNFFAGVL